MKTTAIVPGLIVVNENKVLRDKCIIIEDGKISKIDSAEKAREYGAEEIIEDENLAAIPSLVNAHTHISERLLSGMGDGLPLFEWLEKVVWPHGIVLEGEDVYYVGKLFAMELMASGTGAFNDMYVNNSSALVLGELARSIAETGLKGLLGRGINEANGDAEAALKDTLQSLERWHGYEDRIFITLAPTLIAANSEETLLEIRELAYSKKLKIHIHIAETLEEHKQIKSEKGLTPVEYLDKIGFLDEDVIAAHLVWLGAGDVKILKERGVSAVHNPLSNMRLADGIPATWALKRAGVPIALGADGSASSDNQDLFAAMRLAAFLPRGFTLDPSSMTAREVFAMATRMGYSVLGLRGGELKEGYPADIALIDLRHPSLYPQNDIVNQLVLSAHPGVVKGLIVDGKLLYYDGEYFTINKEEVYLKIQKIIKRIRSGA